MIAGLRGSLLSHDAMEAAGLTRPHGSLEVATAAKTVAGWYAEVAAAGGPAWSGRAVLDRVAVPFCRALHLEILVTGGNPLTCQGLIRHAGSALAAAITLPWGHDPASAWRESVRAAIAARVRWCWCFTGPTLIIFDAERTHARRFAEFELAAIARNERTLCLAWNLLGVVNTGRLALDAAALLSDRHRSAVRESLQSGVHHALTRLTTAFAAASRRKRRRASDRPDGSRLLDESLVVVYRVLFLLFAEARGLVPLWHPLYRESYAIEALRGPVERSAAPRGLWEALQAIARLAHRGCRAGALRVPPFNGRLFSPVHAPLAESAPLNDAAVRDAVLALTTRPTKVGRERISYADLGVEHLGGVYERVLDYEVRHDAAAGPKLVPGGRRKSTGTFYTPRSLTEYLVRRTLAPLVRDASSDEILGLRVLDPAMGSGAFLVAACRYLGTAYEAALVREGILASADISETDRAGFRRLVAQRTLFGVDINPMAVQLARLSLWLTTLSGDRPLTFFDHHLRTGNSLAGASIADVARRASGVSRHRLATTPLFDMIGIDAAIAPAVSSRLVLRNGREDTLEQVRAKEALLARLHSSEAPIAGWKRVADLWCAAWFEPRRAVPSPQAFADLIDRLSGRNSSLSTAMAERLLDTGRDVADRERFFHWELEFPEVFHGPDGSPLARAGFDAIIGNPPWEMLRRDDSRRDSDEDARGAGACLTRFARGSGIYRLQGTGHANLYQLFLERSLALVRSGGRVGLLLPWGLASDHGCASLRRHLLDNTTIDSFVAADNRQALFPIHRGLKFLVMTLTNEPPEQRAVSVPLRAGVHSAAEFDRLPDGEADPLATPISRRLIEQLSGQQLAIPDIRTPIDAEIVGRIASRFSVASDSNGWHLKFGRELNATDDRMHFSSSGPGLPVVEGKQLAPFTVNLAASRHHVPHRLAARLIEDRSFERSRLAYRDVASSTNRLTLIAAVLPAGVVTTHTLFCLKTPLDDDAQQFLAGMFNSFIANYLIRLRVTTHVTVAIVERLPLPKPDRSSGQFKAVVEYARRIADGSASDGDLASLQALAARLYELAPTEFEHVLSTFPLVDESFRRASLSAYLGTV